MPHMFSQSKEDLKKHRKELYQAAKKRRENDPAFIAFKAKIKAKRKEYRQKLKDQEQQKKAALLAQKRAAKEAALQALFIKA